MTKLEERISESATDYVLVEHSHWLEDEPKSTQSALEESYKAGARAILEMPELKALVDALGGLTKEDTAVADGIRIKCTCGREGCVDFYCSAGDRIYTSSYANRIHPEEALAQWRSFIGEESETL